MPAETVSAKKKIIEFAGYKWIVAHSTTPVAPGPNFWSENNVWVDDNGKLHLKLSKDPVTGIWSCAEVASLEQFGFGRYEFFIEGAIDKLDKNIVFGIFQYPGKDLHDEIDIEYARWGNEFNSNLQYSVWPREGYKRSKWSSAKAISLQGTFTTQRITRTPTQISFQSLHGFRNDDNHDFHSATCRRERMISLKAMPLYLNLWLFRGHTPSDAGEVEVVIHGFSFIPHGSVQ